jgi:hypothetical protein
LGILEQGEAVALAEAFVDMVHSYACLISLARRL